MGEGEVAAPALAVDIGAEREKISTSAILVLDARPFATEAPMLISFSVKNWKSFRDQATLSMVASLERQHRDRLAQIRKRAPALRLLPITAIYGGNASGKSNLVKALDFAQSFIVDGTKKITAAIPRQHFRLDKSKINEPTRFSFTILVNEDGAEKIYEFSFALTEKEVVEEELKRFFFSNGTEKEELLYRRQKDRPELELGAHLQNDARLDFSFKATRTNQLFLTASVSQNIETFRSVYDWFHKSLTVLFPESKFQRLDLLGDESSPLYSRMNELFSYFDTGIERLDGDVIPWDKISSMIDIEFKNYLESLEEGMTLRLELRPALFVSVTKTNEELLVRRLLAVHKGNDGMDVPFNFGDESDGTKRLLDIIPILASVPSVTHPPVFVIDELDSSLHSNLTRKIVELYLDGCSQSSRAQIIFTTHDTTLLDQDVLRRDEMWIAERNVAGASSLMSLSEYKDVRYDKDIRKSYLQGRMGGVPKI